MVVVYTTENRIGCWDTSAVTSNVACVGDMLKAIVICVCGLVVYIIDEIDLQWSSTTGNISRTHVVGEII